MGAQPSRDLDQVEVKPRMRDPERGSRILDAAADLFSARGYHAVSMAEIGDAAGIVGSGIYRHFGSKYAVLVALFDRAMEPLLESADAIVAEQADPAATMDRLIQTQIDFCLIRRRSVQLYRSELNTLEPDDARRLRRMQRRYNGEWVTALLELRPDLRESAARLLVHAAIGAIQSIVTYDTGLDEAVQTTWLFEVAERCLHAEPVDGGRG